MLTIAVFGAFSSRYRIIGLKTGAETSMYIARHCRGKVGTKTINTYGAQTRVSL